MTSSAFDLWRDEMHGSLSDPVMNSMSFLNDVAEQFPGALSLAAGRPNENAFDLDELRAGLDRYESHLLERGMTQTGIQRLILQYGDTKGIIRDIVVDMLLREDDIEVSREAVVMTAGCQEALVLVLRAVMRDENDALLVLAPTYVGVLGAARLLDVAVAQVPVSPLADLIPRLERAVVGLGETGVSVRCVYVNPDFANPSGLSLDSETRVRLLALASAWNFLVIEDSPYREFSETDTPPTLKQLDQARRVVHVRTFSKTMYPGLRVGFVLADQTVGGTNGPSLLADEIAKLKSMLTLNTSPVAQAIVGGLILAADEGPRGALKSDYGASRRAFVREFESVVDGCVGVSCEDPGGGFFIIVHVPFDVDAKTVVTAAASHKVIFAPMRMFWDHESQGRAIRVACSDLAEGEIVEAARRLAAFVRSRCDKIRSYP